MIAMRDALQRWKFTILLGALVLGLVVEPILVGEHQHRWLFDLVYSLILVIAALALATNRRLRVAVCVGGGLALLSTWAVYAVPARADLAVCVINHVLNILYLTLVIYVTVRSVIGVPQITWDCISGALAGYLLLGVVWGAAYSLLYCLSPHAFQFGAQFRTLLDAHPTGSPVFLYYSFVTMTTLGYGDISPVSSAARTLSWAEAVSGQFYVAVVVAGFVGVLVSRAAQRATDAARRERAAAEGTEIRSSDSPTA